MKLVCSFRLMLYYQIYGWGLLGAPASLEGDSAETNSTKTDDAVVHVREEHKNERGPIPSKPIDLVGFKATNAS